MDPPGLGSKVKNTPTLTCNRNGCVATTLVHRVLPNDCDTTVTGPGPTTDNQDTSWLLVVHRSTPFPAPAVGARLGTPFLFFLALYPVTSQTAPFGAPSTTAFGQSKVLPQYASGAGAVTFGGGAGRRVSDGGERARVAGGPLAGGGRRVEGGREPG
eukprot:1952928-Rhodomonas_salina.1